MDPIDHHKLRAIVDAALVASTQQTLISASQASPPCAGAFSRGLHIRG